MELEVIGSKIEPINNNYEAYLIENGNQLILWCSNIEYDLWIDCYDIRTLLINYNEIKTIKRNKLKLKRNNNENNSDNSDSSDNNCSNDEDSEEDSDYDYDDEENNNKELNKERYYDLKNRNKNKNKDNNIENDCDDLIEGNGVISDIQEPIVVEDLLPYQPPNFFTYPDHIILPKTQKQFNIISQTVISTQKHRQLEILLKVRQADNILFQFLLPENELYPFYQVCLNILQQ